MPAAVWVRSAKKLTTPTPDLALSAGLGMVVKATGEEIPAPPVVILGMASSGVTAAWAIWANVLRYQAYPRNTISRPSPLFIYWRPA